MKAFIVTDREYHTPAFLEARETLRECLVGRGFELEEADIGAGDLAHCMGCFGCWIKKPGECVIGDKMAELNRKAMNSDAVFYLCPVIFGQFSANIKDAIDRWLPNMLPFFEKRPDGSTMHPPRYDSYPKQVMVGYGDGLTAEDAGLFTDITKKHRTDVEVLVLGRPGANLAAALAGMRLERVGGSL